jgi:hypothetical protein
MGRREKIWMLIFIRVPKNFQKFRKESVNEIKRFHASFSGMVVCKQTGADIGKWFVILKLKWPPVYVIPKMATCLCYS